MSLVYSVVSAMHGDVLVEGAMCRMYLVVKAMCLGVQDEAAMSFYVFSCKYGVRRCAC